MSLKEDKVVLVTGGAGYIGSYICMVLKKEGFFPVVYDNLSIGHSSAVKWGPLIVGDINHRENLKRVFTKYRPKAVMHFAASALVEESVKNPKKYYYNNVSGSLSLLEAMLENKVKYLVFSSTCATYGIPHFLPITEEHQQSPINPYGMSKFIVEQMIEDFCKAHDLCAASLRYFNAAGADMNAQIGEDHSPETHLIPLAIDAALNQSYLNVYGNNFPTEDGTAIRDYIHVEDLASAHIKALKWLFEGGKNITLNLGMGRGFSVLQIINILEGICRSKISLRFMEKREGDSPMLIADNTRAKRLLRWEPKFSIENIVNSAWRWHSYKKREA